MGRSERFFETGFSSHSPSTTCFTNGYTGIGINDMKAFTFFALEGPKTMDAQWIGTGVWIRYMWLVTISA